MVLHTVEESRLDLVAAIGLSTITGVLPLVERAGFSDSSRFVPLGVAIALVAVATIFSTTRFRHASV